MEKDEMGLVFYEFELAEAAGQFARGLSVLQHAVKRGSRGAERPVDGRLVVKPELERTFADHGGLDVHEFPVVGGLPELDRKFQDRGGKTLGFHVGIACADHAEEFRAGLFEPDRIDGVVDYPHLVGFCVPDLDAGGVLVCACFHVPKYN